MYPLYAYDAYISSRPTSKKHCIEIPKEDQAAKSVDYTIQFHTLALSTCQRQVCRGPSRSRWIELKI